MAFIKIGVVLNKPCIGKNAERAHWRRVFLTKPRFIISEN